MTETPDRPAVMVIGLPPWTAGDWVLRTLPAAALRLAGREQQAAAVQALPKVTEQRWQRPRSLHRHYRPLRRIADDLDQHWAQIRRHRPVRDARAHAPNTAFGPTHTMLIQAEYELSARMVKAAGPGVRIIYSALDTTPDIGDSLELLAETVQGLASVAALDGAHLAYTQEWKSWEHWLPYREGDSWLRWGVPLTQYRTL
ncbi:hypothetical protein ACIGO9_30600 [Nocardia asteroides]|uniref:hypothetical protein n=1 Tax=Nocardia asteroides TaxID=1824 RepID=UPI0037C9BEAB